MTTKPITFQEEIRKTLVKYKKDYSGNDYGLDKANKALSALFQKVFDKAISPKEEYYKDFNSKKSFIENLENSNKIARNELKDQIRASFKDIVEGKIKI